MQIFPKHKKVDKNSMEKRKNRSARDAAECECCRVKKNREMRLISSTAPDDGRIINHPTTPSLTKFPGIIPDYIARDPRFRD